MAGLNVVESAPVATSNAATLNRVWPFTCGERAADVERLAVGRDGERLDRAVDGRGEGGRHTGVDVVGEDVAARHQALPGVRARRAGVGEAAAREDRVARDGLRPDDARVDLHRRQRIGGHRRRRDCAARSARSRQSDRPRMPARPAPTTIPVATTAETVIPTTALRSRGRQADAKVMPPMCCIPNFGPSSTTAVIPRIRCNCTRLHGSPRSRSAAAAKRPTPRAPPLLRLPHFEVVDADGDRRVGRRSGQVRLDADLAGCLQLRPARPWWTRTSRSARSPHPPRPCR